MTEETDLQNRRTVLRGAAVLGGTAAVGVVLAACGGGTAGDGEGAGAEPEAKSGTGLGPSSEVPVGGGQVFGDEKVVVTQPSEGEFKAFTAVCTHQGCLVSVVSEGSIGCSCHGSSFSAEDGSVTGGPAPSPLDEIGVTDDGGTLRLT